MHLTLHQTPLRFSDDARFYNLASSVGSAPLLAVRCSRGVLNACMPLAQQQGVGRTDPGPEQPKVGGRVEQARVPALPSGQELLDLFAKSHRIAAGLVLGALA